IGLAHTTKALESNRNTLDEVLPALDFILKQYEDGKAQYKDDPVMSTYINSGWAKLDKYYALTSETPAYVGALVLHPAYKWQYIQEHWEEAWWQPSKTALEKMWKEKYMPAGIDTRMTQARGPRPAQS